MTKTVDAPALLVAMLGAVLALTLVTSPYGWLASIGGLVLLVTLFAFDRDGYRGGFESFAFAAALAFCLMVAAAAPLTMVAASEGRAASVPGEWLPLLWVGLTVIFWPIDRARMSGRVQPVASFSFQAAALSAPPVPGPPIYPPTQAYPAPAPAYQPPVPQYAPAPAPVERPAAGSIFRSEPVMPSATSLFRSEPAPAPVPAAAPIAAPAPVFAPVPVAAAAGSAPEPVPPPVPQIMPIPPGREATIYVNLIGEGINLMRPVQAETLGRDYYRIVDEMPEGETWEFKPGQVVKCKKKTLSSGKAMVAVEEAPRAQ